MTERLGASFRDPAGFVFRRDGVLYRQVNDCHRDNYELLKSSGLYEHLSRRGLLIRHDEVDVRPADPTRGALVIKPEEVAFVSYPFEWSPGQLRAAGLATLDIQRAALEHGMTLRDASAYNIQFHHGQPVLIDTLSFEPMAEGNPWAAYGQYCRHFLAPLALMRYVDVRLGGLLRTEIDGVPLELASRLLPRRTRFRIGLAVHVHAHASSTKRHSNRATLPRAAGQPSRPISQQATFGLLDSLRSATTRQVWNPPSSQWRDYYALRESYSSESMQSKIDLVGKVLQTLPAALVLDLGANTGTFSRLAADVVGAQVVAVEMDPSAVEIHWRENRHEGVLPLLNNLANPTPSQGWAHEELSSLEDRGPADVVLALALIHHLAIGNNVPLPSIFAYLARLGRSVVVEWVPKDDPMVQRLLASRADIFTDYTTEGFEMAAREHFHIRQKEEIQDSSRALYVLERL